MPLKGDCGAGEETLHLRCIKYEINRSRGSNQLLVDLSNCDQHEVARANATYKRACNIQCGFYKWLPVESDCSVSCGDGFKTRTYECFDIRTNRAIDPSYCANLVKPDTEHLRCNNSCYKWQTTSWSEV